MYKLHVPAPICGWKFNYIQLTFILSARHSLNKRSRESNKERMREVSWPGKCKHLRRSTPRVDYTSVLIYRNEFTKENEMYIEHGNGQQTISQVQVQLVLGCNKGLAKACRDTTWQLMYWRVDVVRESEVIYFKKKVNAVQLNDRARHLRGIWCPNQITQIGTVASVHWG